MVSSELRVTQYVYPVCTGLSLQLSGAGSLHSGASGTPYGLRVGSTSRKIHLHIFVIICYPKDTCFEAHTYAKYILIHHRILLYYIFVRNSAQAKNLHIGFFANLTVDTDQACLMLASAFNKL